MNDIARIRTKAITELANLIDQNLQDLHKEYTHQKDLDLEALIYLVFKIVDELIKDKTYSKAEMNYLLKGIINTYLFGMDLNLFVSNFSNIKLGDRH